jgi:hypothetical protein
MIADGRAHGRFAKKNYYAGRQSVTPGAGAPVALPVTPKRGFRAWVASFFRT